MTQHTHGFAGCLQVPVYMFGQALGQLIACSSLLCRHLRSCSSLAAALLEQTAFQLES